MKPNIAVRMACTLIWQIIASTILAIITFYLLIIVVDRMTRNSYDQRSFLKGVYYTVGQMPMAMLAVQWNISRKVILTTPSPLSGQHSCNN
ncbi:hypothetical protein ACIQYG_25550 [Peribacillus sp. NPDC096622]|uniref:hypothetical protein n=1 Tax=Peribacillus sp. NPDC096622 TaxID=3364396 RepID=UPI0038263BC0